MKNVILSSFLAVVLAVFTSVNIHAADSKTVSYKSSMTCGACKSAIIKTLNADTGIQEVEADVASNIVTVKYDPDKTNEVNIASNIKKAGFKADKNTATKDCAPKECGSKGAKEGCSEVKQTGKSGCCSKETKTKKS